MRPRLPFRIIYEDRDCIAVDKPAGMLTTSTNAMRRSVREAQFTVENVLTDYVRKGQLKSPLRAWPVHRLDRGTSGVVLFAKSQRLAEELRARWGEIAEKTYAARVEGRLAAPSGRFESYLRDDPHTMKVSSVRDPELGKLAVTKWRRVSESGGTTLVEVDLQTGRKNQIRVHFSEAGHPVAGDVKYGAKPAARLFLHAARLVVSLPAGRMTIESQPDKEFFA